LPVTLLRLRWLPVTFARAVGFRCYVAGCVPGCCPVVYPVYGYVYVAFVAVVRYPVVVVGCCWLVTRLRCGYVTRCTFTRCTFSCGWLICRLLPGYVAVTRCHTFTRSFTLIYALIYVVALRLRLPFTLLCVVVVAFTLPRLRGCWFTPRLDVDCGCCHTFYTRLRLICWTFTPGYAR